MGPLSREINGPRPAPLKIHKDSHHIQKPVIIYTHSPKVIHTHASDFMALVQKLTGMAHHHEDEKNDDDDEKPKNNMDGNACNYLPPSSKSNSTSTSTLTATSSPELEFDMKINDNGFVFDEIPCLFNSSPEFLFSPGKNIMGKL